MLIHVDPCWFFQEWAHCACLESPRPVSQLLAPWWPHLTETSRQLDPNWAVDPCSSDPLGVERYFRHFASGGLSLFPWDPMGPSHQLQRPWPSHELVTTSEGSHPSRASVKVELTHGDCNHDITIPTSGLYPLHWRHMMHMSCWRHETSACDIGRDAVASLS